MICVSGYGKVKTDGFVTWIDVTKWKSEWFHNLFNNLFEFYVPFLACPVIVQIK